MDKNEHVILYTTDCPKCKILKERLDKANIAYKEDTNVAKMLKEGIVTVPMLDNGVDLLSYAEAIEWVRGEQE